MPTIPHESTAQEVFDFVANHLRKQGQPSLRNTLRTAVNGNRCAYRGINNLTCAVGCLMTDDEYKPSMEGLGVITLMHNHNIPHADDDTTLWHRHGQLLNSLQEVHDDSSLLTDEGKYNKPKLERRLAQSADRFNLTYKAPDGDNT